MKKLKFLTYSMIALMLIFSVACEGEEGAIGPAGIDGINGIDGTDGQDGNANVNTYTYDLSTMTGSIWQINAPQLTQDVLDNDGILCYVRRSNIYYPVPGTAFNDEIKVNLVLNASWLYFYNRMSGANITPTVGTYDLFKLVIIESSSTSSGRTSYSPTQRIQNELENAGVDINNYEDVMDYYGLEY